MGVFVGPGRGCVTADARVVMPNGTTKPLPEVQIGDSVITHDGSLQKVTNTFKYPVKEELLTIKTYYGDVEGITLTKDHKVLVSKKDKTLKWLQAREIQVGDWLFIPKTNIDLPIYTAEENEKLKRISVAYPFRVRHDKQHTLKGCATEADSVLFEYENHWKNNAQNAILVQVEKISTVKSTGKELFVYDIEVENNANYLTSSFLVHNSAAGSAVAYCTGITNIDPIKYDLLFERFLNPERVSMPDIDIDFDDEGRQSVIDYVIKKYGKNQVAQIITYGTMAAKMAIKDVARALELDLPTSNQLAKYVPEKPGTKLSDAYAEVQELKEILALTEDPRTKVLQDAKVLEGSIRGTGIHAAGVIIAPKDLLECVPVCTAKDSDLWVTQFDGKVVESAGMLKMDFLGLKTLTIMKDALKIIKKNRGIDIDLDTIPIDDAKTFELYQNASTIGTFQFESEGMQMYLKQLKPNNIEDLIAMNALYRPGPLQFIPLYIDRKHGREVTEFAHPLLEPLLGRTFGIMVYQEQIMQTAQVLAGYSLGGADLLRRAMGKKDKAEMDRQRETFVKGAKEKNDIPEEKANEIFDIMAKFAEYGFNRSHSAAYSVVAYQTAYLKANYPAEYMASVLSHNMTIEKITFFLEECQKMGVQVLGPDVNDSDLDFSVNEQGQIRFGLAAIKGTGEAAVDGIIEERNKGGKFKDIFDFVQRLNLRAVNKKSLESLAQAGGFDSFGIDRATYFTAGQDGMPFIEKLVKYGNSFQKDQENTGASLFGGSTQAQIATPAIPQGEPWGKLERLNREKEVVGFYISGHPLDQYRTAILSFRAVPLSRINEFDKQEIHVAGIVTAKTIKQGSKGAFTTFMLEDYQSSLEFALFGINSLLLDLLNSYSSISLTLSRNFSPLHVTLFDSEEKYSTELTSQRYEVNISDALFSKLDGMKLEYKLVF
ncbi:MAG: DNA polymerase III subunit alpha [Bacteroidetes bacterium]|nr:MAG: DNA polymerase III subunit alpha [Bacteroidota bacterium]